MVVRVNTYSSLTYQISDIKFTLLTKNKAQPLPIEDPTMFVTFTPTTISRLSFHRKKNCYIVLPSLALSIH